MTTPLRLCAEHPFLAEAHALVDGLRFAFEVFAVLHAPESADPMFRATAVGCMLRTAPFPVCLVAPALTSADTPNETER